MDKLARVVTSSLAPDEAAHSHVLPPGHPTAVVFLDETGVVHRASDRYFGIGCLKARDPSPLLQGLHRLREQAGFHDELHWADFDKAKLRGRDDLVELGKAAIDLVFDSDDAEFCCHIADRAAGDLTARFHRHPYPGHKAYEWLAAQVLDAAVGDTEIVTVLADRLSTSPAVRFESDVAAVVNQRRRRLAVSSVCRLDSRSTDGLQLVDVLLGATALDLRQGRTGGARQKQALLEHLLDRCGWPSFRPGGRSHAGKFTVKLLSKPRRARRIRRGG